MDSILTSIKKLLGIPEEYTQFDPDVLMHINTVLGILTQIGVINKNVSIEDKTSKWFDVGVSEENEGMIRSYVYMKVRLLFDPPQGSLVDAMERQIKELECRMQMNAELKEGLEND